MNSVYKLDTIIKVDETLCISCGNCIRTCPAGSYNRLTSKYASVEMLHQPPCSPLIAPLFQGITLFHFVPNLSLLNLAAVNVGKEFMLSHGYIKNDFDVNEWAAPEFLEAAARELLEEEWKKKTTSKLPHAAGSLASGGRIG